MDAPRRYNRFGEQLTANYEVVTQSYLTDDGSINASARVAGRTRRRRSVLLSGQGQTKNCTSLCRPRPQKIGGVGMVTDIRGRYKPQIKTIASILRDAEVPSYWYSIDVPVDGRISIMGDDDGIHVFIPERGQRTGEKIYTDWYDALMDAADSFELKYTEKIQSIAKWQQQLKTKLPVIYIAANQKTLSWWENSMWEDSIIEDSIIEVYSKQVSKGAQNQVNKE